MENKETSKENSWWDVVMCWVLSIVGIFAGVLSIGWAIGHSINSYHESKYKVCVTANTPEERKDGTFYNYRANCFDKAF